jgi:hypothetical protein
MPAAAAAASVAGDWLELAEQSLAERGFALVDSAALHRDELAVLRREWRLVRETLVPNNAAAAGAREAALDSALVKFGCVVEPCAPLDVRTRAAASVSREAYRRQRAARARHGDAALSDAVAAVALCEGGRAATLAQLLDRAVGPMRFLYNEQYVAKPGASADASAGASASASAGVSADASAGVDETVESAMRSTVRSRVGLRVGSPVKSPAQSTAPAPGATAFAWHRDADLARTCDAFVSAWIPLVDVGPHNGGLRFRPYGERPGHEQDEVVDVVARAGSVVLIAHDVLHCSYPNVSRFARPAYMVQYSSLPMHNARGEPIAYCVPLAPVRAHNLAGEFYSTYCTPAIATSIVAVAPHGQASKLCSS